MKKRIFMIAAIFALLIFSACSRNGREEAEEYFEETEYPGHTLELTDFSAPADSIENAQNAATQESTQAPATPDILTPTPTPDAPTPDTAPDDAPTLDTPTPNAQESALPHAPLIFNTPRVIYICDEPPFFEYDFMVMLRYEQMRTVFGEIAARLHYAGGFAKVFYRYDGSIIEVEAAFNLSQWPLYQPLTIQIGLDGPPIGWHSFRTYQFPGDAIFIYSFVHGIPVLAKMIESYRHTVMNFEASFMLSGMYFRVRFYETEQRGRAQMAETITTIISGGTEGFNILENPDVPHRLQV